MRFNSRALNEEENLMGLVEELYNIRGERPRTKTNNGNYIAKKKSHRHSKTIVHFSYHSLLHFHCIKIVKRKRNKI